VSTVYRVETIRDGGSYTTRRVTAQQHGEATFMLSASFHAPEEGSPTRCRNWPRPTTYPVRTKSWPERDGLAREWFADLPTAIPSTSGSTENCPVGLQEAARASDLGTGLVAGRA
jgi:acyl-CoA thioesterase-2